MKSNIANGSVVNTSSKNKSATELATEILGKGNQPTHRDHVEETETEKRIRLRDEEYIQRRRNDLWKLLDKMEQGDNAAGRIEVLHTMIQSFLSENQNVGNGEMAHKYIQNSIFVVTEIMTFLSETESIWGDLQNFDPEVQAAIDRD